MTTNPKYPVYIVSKGRSDTMLSSRALSRMKIPHYIAIEPQDYEDYDKSLDTFGIRKYVTLLVLPFSNHGDGPGRARNWCWDHTIHLGAKRFWVMDDNIESFYRLHNNCRIRVESGCMFRAMEDFNDRYSNVPMSGLQYRFFCAPNQSYPPFVLNTRIYSCALIDVNCKHRFRGKYNEDTIISLDILKDGDCTIQFNCFLQGKAATQTIKGGNTQEFYHVEGEMDTKKWIDGVNPSGTINKSQMLYDAHPDVTTLVWKYKRVHHYVNYLPFKDNKLKYIDGYDPDKEPLTNNYGLKLIQLNELSDLDTLTQK